MINLTEELKTFENGVCGGYHEYIYNDNDEKYIGDHIENYLKERGVSNFAIENTYAFDNPGIDIRILSVAYEGKDGSIELETFELISC